MHVTHKDSTPEQLPQEPAERSQHSEQKQYRTKYQNSVNTQEKVLTSTL